MNEKLSLVVTSIASPNHVLRALAEGCRGRGHRFIVVGDVPSPRDFRLEGCDFYGLEEQYETGLGFARLCPTRHYARKNLWRLFRARLSGELGGREPAAQERLT